MESVRTCQILIQNSFILQETHVNVVSLGKRSVNVPGSLLGAATSI